MWPPRPVTASRGVSRWGFVRRRLIRSWTALGDFLSAFADAERGRFVLWLPVFMGTGVLTYFSLRAEPTTWIAAECAAAAFIAAMPLGEFRVLRGIALSIGFAALGFASAQYATARLPPIEADLPSHAVIATGTAQAVEILSYARRITLSSVELAEAEKPPARSRRGPGKEATVVDDPAEPALFLTRTARIRLMTGDETSVSTGDTVRVRSMVRQPLPPALPGGWDTQRDAFFSGLGASGWALGQIEVTAHVAPGGITAWVQRLRETIAGRVTAVVPGAAGTIIVTLLTGGSRGIPEADHAAFRQSGLAHLLAVAGLHIGIVMGFALGFARTALALSETATLFWPTKKIAIAAALAVGGFYMVLTGGHVPIVRGFSMACVMTLAILAGRQPISVRGLGLAGIGMMLISPWEVPNVSFQMSFSAVLALISGYETLRPRLRLLHGGGPAKRLLSHMAALALTSALAGTAALPYGAYHFGQIQIYYVLSNMFAVPVTALWVMPAGMIALGLMPLGLERFALIPMEWGTTVIMAIAHFTAALPESTMGVPHMPAWGLAVLSCGIAWLGIWRSRVRVWGVAGILLGLLAPALDRPPDILVSADAGLIGIRTDQGVFLQQTHGGSNFTRDAWLTRWNAGSAAPLPPETPAGSTVLNCSPDSCLFRPRADERAALLLRGPSRPADCAAASVLVSAEPARGRCPWPAPPLVDRFTVWKAGSAAIWLGPNGVFVLTDREARGDRPWVAPPPKPHRRPVSNLPMAPVDDGQ